MNKIRDLENIQHLTEAQLKHVVTRCKENHLSISYPVGLKLTCGNCGCFAIALKYLMGKGELVIHGRPNNHVEYILNVNDNKLYDGAGVHDLEEEAEAWSDMESLVYGWDEQDIFTRNDWELDIPHMEQVILMLANDVPIDEIKEFYGEHRRDDSESIEYCEEGTENYHYAEH